MTTATKTKRPGRKVEQVLEGARQVFFADGFEGANVDDIARAARVSKATLYSYFPDKRQLFIEVIQTECTRQTENAMQSIDTSAPPQNVLLAAANHMVAMFLSEFSQKIFRICVAEADRFPDLGREFYESGPMMARLQITTYLRESAAQGHFAISDFDLAADQFVELCKSALFPRMVFGIQSEFSDAEIDRVVTGAVDVFIARYGA